MAIYHLHMEPISRGKGQNVIAAATYRAGEKLYDELHEKYHDYSKKSDVLHKEILIPEEAPNWMKDRELLWNYVEQQENRKDSQLARDVNIAMPRELSVNDNIELARGFIQKQFVDKGMVADWALHHEVKDDGYTQPHVHILLTMRHIEGDGFGLKNTDWNSKKFLNETRETWSEMANCFMAERGIDARIDHRTLIEQGITLTPQNRIGLKAHQEAGLLQEQAREHQQIALANGKKLLENPSLVLQALNHQYATFTPRSIDNYLFRNTHTTEQFQALQAKVMSLPELMELSVGEDGQPRYTTQAMLDMERGLLEQVATLSQQAWGSLTQFSLEGLSQEKIKALEEIDNGSRIACLQGFAGTGKSSLLGIARAGWEAEGYRVMGMALSGIAAEQLQRGSGIESRTIASFLYGLEQGRIALNHQNILVLDEAGMVGTRQMAQLLQATQDTGVKWVMVGDMHQLPAIEAGAPFRAICQQCEAGSLRTIVRQQEDWQIKATQALAAGQTQVAFEAYRAHHAVHHFATHQEAMETLVEDWRSDNFHSSIILAYTRADVSELQTMARAELKRAGTLGPEQSFALRDGDLAIAQHERVMFLSNHRELGVKNGTLGTVVDFQGKDKLWVALDGRESQSLLVDTQDYDAINYGYATTMHKAQGMTVDASYVLISPHMNREATYVAGSRHAEQVQWYWGQDTMRSEMRMEQLLGRAGAKDNVLDYGIPTIESAPVVAEPTIDQLSPQEKLEKAQETIELARSYLSHRGEILKEEYHHALMDANHDANDFDQLSKAFEQYQSQTNILDNYWLDINIMNDITAAEKFWHHWDGMKETMNIDLEEAKTIQANQISEPMLEVSEKSLEGPDFDDYEMER